jgi:hypothetical protein
MNQFNQNEYYAMHDDSKKKQLAFMEAPASVRHKARSNSIPANRIFASHPSVCTFLGTQSRRCSCTLQQVFRPIVITYHAWETHHDVLQAYGDTADPTGQMDIDYDETGEELGDTDAERTAHRHSSDKRKREQSRHRSSSRKQEVCPRAPVHTGCMSACTGDDAVGQAIERRDHHHNDNHQYNQTTNTRKARIAQFDESQLL